MHKRIPTTHRPVILRAEADSIGKSNRSAMQKFTFIVNIFERNCHTYSLGGSSSPSC